ncbi:response regulator [Pseudomonas sp.]|uniref:response regulator n=1 Tax=Pseudomonas sp. TaxID=306 RepID=UPI0026DC448C|nr:response regulator [Pseudomonas sp.]MDO4235993.1 response regulator [Pseudomonas sp.]
MTSNPAPIITSPHVFIVEDETMLAILMEDMLDELGYATAFHASALGEGLAYAKEGEYDLAILDINIIGGSSFPIACEIAQRGIPFFFCSGYGRQGMPAEWTHRRCLAKPISLEQLDAAMSELIIARDQVPLLAPTDEIQR